MTWTNTDLFEDNFCFGKISSKKADLEFEDGSSEPIWIKDLSVHVCPDAMMREFENGFVLANPSDHDHMFNFEALTPGKKYKRLIGS